MERVIKGWIARAVILRRLPTKAPLRSGLRVIYVVYLNYGLADGLSLKCFSNEVGTTCSSCVECSELAKRGNMGVCR